jgi:hypothetical protein
MSNYKICELLCVIKTVLCVVETDDSQEVLYRSCTIIINPLAIELNAGCDLQKAGI